MPITKATASSIAPAAKGDLVVGSATNDAAVLGVGSNDQVLTADSSTATGLKWAAVAGGTTVKVQSDAATTTVTSSSTTYVDTGLEVSITPTANTSKVLILASIPVGHNTDTSVGLRLMRGSTELQASRVAGNATSTDQAAYVYLDSPATTSATTYKFQINRWAGSGTAYYAPDGAEYGQMVAMEIGA